MKLTLKQIALPVIGLGVAHGQATPAPKPLMMEDVFKNVQVLKGIPVNPQAGYGIKPRMDGAG